MGLNPLAVDVPSLTLDPTVFKAKEITRMTSTDLSAVQVFTLAMHAITNKTGEVP